MKIDMNIVARALDKAGQEPLTQEEISSKDGTRWRLVKDFYLAVILEALSNTEWTSQKKRARLKKSEEENLTTYRVMYELPIDCAKTVELVGEQEYLVEDGYLYTNAEGAILVYVSNGFTNEQYNDEDYNFYKTPNLDPQLSAYIETKLAANIALKLTGNYDLYQLLFSEAAIMENRAVKASVAHGHSKDKGDRWWGEELGMPGYDTGDTF